MLGRLAPLAIYYFAQGLPFGIQVMALPTLLAGAGANYTKVSLSMLLGAPWALKLFFAPLVDRFFSERLGRRRSWILPLTLAGALIAAASAHAVTDEQLLPLLIGLFFLNFAAATMDVAVDGLAVSTLRPSELGLGNAVQVVGYKLGMLTTGGLLLAHHETIGARGLLEAVALANLIAAVVALATRETNEAEGPRESAEPPTSLRALVHLLRASLQNEIARAALLLAATYKLGESMMDVLFRPYLVNAGFGTEEIGLTVGTYGTVAGVVGSAMGGLVYSALGLRRALLLTALARALALAAQLGFVLHDGDLSALALVTVAEHAAGGALTTVVFAAMMAASDPRVGGTAFTLFATVEVASKGMAGLAAGPLADAFGVPLTYALGVSLSVAFIAIVAKAAPALERRRTP